MSAPVLLQRQQLDRLWDIDRSEIIDTLYRLQDGKLQAYPDYYDVRGWDPHDRETYTPIHEACFDRGGAFFARFEGEEIVAAAALDTEPRGPQRICASCCSLRQRAQTRPGAGQATVSTLPASGGTRRRCWAIRLLHPQQKHRRLLSGAGLPAHRAPGCRAVRPRAGGYSPGLPLPLKTRA